MSGWDSLFADPFWRRWAERPPLPVTRNWIERIRRAGVKRVYDLGCGMGRHTVLLASLGFDVVASDVSALAVEATRASLERSGLSAEVVEADMCGIPFADAAFDAVLSLDVLEHNTRSGLERAIGEVWRVLRSGGRMLASFALRTRWLGKDEPGRDMIEDNTLRSYGPEEMVHHLVDEDELRGLLREFRALVIDRVEESWETCSSATFVVSAVRP